MSKTDADEVRPTPPQKIGCRVCMSTAKLTEQFAEAAHRDQSGHATAGHLTYGTYRCDEGHLTQTVFDDSDGSLRIYEPDETP